MDLVHSARNVLSTFTMSLVDHSPTLWPDDRKMVLGDEFPSGPG